MNLIHTDENFSSMPAKDKINLVKGLNSGTIEEASAPELNITVMIDSEGNHTLSPDGEVIDLGDWNTIENYLKAKYPLSNISINEVLVDTTNNDRTKAA